MTSKPGIIARPHIAAASGWVARDAANNSGDFINPGAAGGGVILLPANSSLATSERALIFKSTNDGVTWTRNDVQGQTGHVFTKQMAYANGVFLLGANPDGGDVTAGGLYTTADGITFTQRIGAGFQVKWIAHNGQAGAASRIMAVGDQRSTVHGRVWLSSDGGATWALKTPPSNDPGVCVVHNGLAGTDGRWVMSTYDNIWVSADDGASWTDVTPAGLDGFDFVAHGNGHFVALGVDSATFTLPRLGVSDETGSAFSVVVLPFDANPPYEPTGIAHNGLTGGGSRWLVLTLPQGQPPAGPSFATASDPTNAGGWTGKNDAVYDAFCNDGERQPWGPIWTGDLFVVGNTKPAQGVSTTQILTYQ